MPDENKLPLTSSDVTVDVLAQLQEIAPQVFTEGRVDFDKLKATLGENIVPKEERYGLSWAGKSEAFRNVQIPSVGTLLPQSEESVNFDTSENLIIEGDNLEVLKLLQKSYHGKVKMIYIDPPYNTGNEFIYPDNYHEGLDDYLKYSGQVTEEGQRRSSDTETSGRYHSKWLNMMYPRLFLARNLLRNDGVIFVSIDDHEHQNLLLLMNEIFGEESFVADVSVVNNLKGRNDRKHIATCHEYLVIYAKQNFVSNGVPLTDEQRAVYKFTDKAGQKYALRDLRKRGRPDRREDRPKMYFPIFFNPANRSCSLERQSDADIEITPKRGDGSDGRWRWGRERVSANLSILEPRFSQKNNRWDVDHRVYLNPPVVTENDDEEDDDDDAMYERTSKPKSIWIGGELSTDVGRRSMKNLLPELEYDYPKAPDFIKRCLYMGLGKGDIVLDFFAGSGTTGQATLDLNQEDNGKRKFILVQLPEKTQIDNFPTISYITRERCRRVINKLNHETPLTDQDRGFKAFKLSSSNFKIWNADTTSTEPESIAEQLRLYADNVERERTQQDILYELVLKSGLPLSAKVEQIEVAGKPVYSIAQGQLLICLENEISQEVLRGMIALNPIQMVCLDQAFGVSVRSVPS